MNKTQELWEKAKEGKLTREEYDNFLVEEQLKDINSHESKDSGISGDGTQKTSFITPSPSNAQNKIKEVEKDEKENSTRNN